MLNDQLQRNQIVQELNRNIFVEAGAGSGKTTAMVGRMVALLEKTDIKAQEVVAITFTNQAARHLKEKFQLALEERLTLLRTENSETEGLVRLENAYSHMHTLFMGTIHSFCQMILTEMPIESGLDSEYTLLEEQDEEEYRRTFWALYKGDWFREYPGMIHHLNDLGVDLDALDGLFEAMSRYADMEFPEEPVEKPDVSQAFQNLVNFLEDYFLYIAPEGESNDLFSKTVHQLKSEMAHHEDQLSESRKIHYLLQFSFWGSLKIVQKLWTDPQVAKSLLNEEWPAYQASYLDAFCGRWMDYVYREILPLMKVPLQEYQNKRRRDNVLSFLDLLVRTTEMLKTQSHVRRYWQKKCRTLLVDEFQDTDPVQSEMIFYLTGEDCEEVEWMNLVPRAGSLFVVGDPKQSIYRFRRADIRIYNRVKEIFQETGGLLCALKSNFRSKKAIGDWINGVFDSKEAFAEKATEFQAAFMPLNCVKKGDSQLALMKISSDAKKIDERVQEEAKRIASFIADELQNKESHPKDYMILSYNAQRLGVYEKACKALGLPTRLVVKQNQDVSLLLRDMHRFVKWLRQPQNEFLGYGVLRSSLFGFEDTDLAKYRLEQEGSFELPCYSRFSKGSVAQGGGRDLSHEEGKAPAPLRLPPLEKEILRGDRILEAFHLIEKWVKNFMTQKPMMAFYDWVAELSFFNFALSLPQGEFEANSLALFMELCSTRDDKRVLSLLDLDELFEDYFVQKQKLMHGFEKDLQNAIVLMNLHQAKGLEAKTVFLVDPAQRRVHDPEFYVKREHDSVRSYLSFLALTKNNCQRKIFAQPLAWPSFAVEEQKHEEAEKKRLLYVAVTRAKERLVITSKERSVWGHLFSHLEGLEELPAISSNSLSPGYGVLSLKKEEKLHISSEDWEGRWQEVQTPSYLSHGVTDKKGSNPSLGITGWGSAFGEGIHQALEEVVRRRHEPEVILESIVRAYVAEELCIEALRQMQVFLKSSLFQRIQESRELYLELPFTIPINNTENPEVLTGVIDLLFREGEEWVIVDYKTNRVQGNVEEFVAFYRPQLLAYQKAWEQLSGGKVKECFLYFTSLGYWR
jgi:ATP-dependent helicase/nuclease subunit A